MFGPGFLLTEWAYFFEADGGIVFYASARLFMLRIGDRRQRLPQQFEILPSNSRSRSDLALIGKHELLNRGAVDKIGILRRPAKRRYPR